jgi:hypothetical protein
MAREMIKKNREEYQLVLQFSHNGLKDYDELIAMEDALTAKLGDDIVDGHDAGSGEMNIFMFTTSPESTFEKCLTVLTESQAKGMKAAYRLVSGDDYTVIWPKNSTESFEIK